MELVAKVMYMYIRRKIQSMYTYIYIYIEYESSIRSYICIIEHLEYTYIYKNMYNNKSSSRLIYIYIHTYNMKDFIYLTRVGVETLRRRLRCIDQI